MKTQIKNKNVEKICNIVIEYLNENNPNFYITHEMFYSKTRKGEVKEARQIAMYFSKEHLHTLSLAMIGHNVGGKDHTTVLHSCKTINNLVDTDKSFRNQIESIRKLIPDMENNHIIKNEIFEAIIKGLCNLIKRKDKHQVKPEDIKAENLFNIVA